MTAVIAWLITAAVVLLVIAVLIWLLVGMLWVLAWGVRQVAALFGMPLDNHRAPPP